MPSPSALGAPFLARELNGETLLEELQRLRAAGIRVQALQECALALRPLRGLPTPMAAGPLRELAAARFSGQPALAALLREWVGRVKLPGDSAALCAHFERLAVVATLLVAVRQAAEPGGGGR